MASNNPDCHSEAESDLKEVTVTSPVYRPSTPDEDRSVQILMESTLEGVDAGYCQSPCSRNKSIESDAACDRPSWSFGARADTSPESRLHAFRARTRYCLLLEVRRAGPVESPPPGYAWTENLVRDVMIPAFYGIDFRHDKLEVVCTEIGDAILFFGGRGDRCGLTYPQTEEAMAGIDPGFVWVGNPVHLRLTPLTVREGRHWIAEFQREKRESRSPVTGRRVTETRQERVARQKLRDLAEISPKAAAREIRKLKKMSSLSEESVGLQGASPLGSGEKGRHRQDAVKRSDKYKAAKASKEKKTKADKAKGEKNGKCSQASTSGDRPSEKVLDRLRKQAQGREPSPSPPPSDNSSDGSEDDSGDDDSGSGQSGQDSGEETGSEQDPTDGDETSSGEESPRR